FSKEKIFETYLNVVEFGEDLYGIGPASWHYFGKPASELNAKEGAFLAMLLPSPIRYSESFREKELSPYAAKIIRTILRKMVILGHLTREEAREEWEAPLSFEAVALQSSLEEEWDEDAPAESGEETLDP